jgi:hypothetical protein
VAQASACGLQPRFAWARNHRLKPVPPTGVGKKKEHTATLPDLIEVEKDPVFFAAL